MRIGCGIAVRLEPDILRPPPQQQVERNHHDDDDERERVAGRAPSVSRDEDLQRRQKYDRADADARKCNPDGEPAAAANLAQRGHVDALAEKVDREDGLGARLDRSRDAGGNEVDAVVE